jgi:hypothetical protein
VSGKAELLGQDAGLLVVIAFIQTEVTRFSTFYAA